MLFPCTLNCFFSRLSSCRRSNSESIFRVACMVWYGMVWRKSALHSMTAYMYVHSDPFSHWFHSRLLGCYVSLILVHHLFICTGIPSGSKHRVQGWWCKWAVRWVDVPNRMMSASAIAWNSLSLPVWVEKRLAWSVYDDHGTMALLKCCKSRYNMILLP